MPWTERTKPTNSATESEHQGPYDFSLLNVFWDREDIYFDNDAAFTERTKPTDSATERTKPSDSATERTKPTDSWTERTKPT